MKLVQENLPNFIRLKPGPSGNVGPRFVVEEVQAAACVNAALIGHDVSIMKILLAGSICPETDAKGVAEMRRYLLQFYFPPVESVGDRLPVVASGVVSWVTRVDVNDARVLGAVVLPQRRRTML
ncbi:MAG: hypothetical protein IID44_27370, partial [Planctomycetes bacterium]|nr:hypothetical protein [Planctomycetota bacterium]